MAVPLDKPSLAPIVSTKSTRVEKLQVPFFKFSVWPDWESNTAYHLLWSVLNPLQSEKYLLYFDKQGGNVRGLLQVPLVVFVLLFHFPQQFLLKTKLVGFYIELDNSKHDKTSNILPLQSSGCCTIAYIWKEIIVLSRSQETIDANYWQESHNVCIIYKRNVVVALFIQ